jgi:hypothetical protein
VNWAKKDSTPVPTREKVKGESKAPNQEGNKNRNTPIVPPVIVKTPNGKEPRYSQAVLEKNVSRDVNRDRFERTGQLNSNKENLERKNSTTSPMRERTRVESPNPVTQSPQKNASVNVNQNRFERAGQSNSSQSLPTHQEGITFVGRPSLPEGRSSSPPAPASKGQGIQPNRGSAGGFFGSSPLRSFH